MILVKCSYTSGGVHTLSVHTVLEVFIHCSHTVHTHLDWHPVTEMCAPEPRSDSPTAGSDSIRQSSDNPTVRQSDSPTVRQSDSVRQCPTVIPTAIFSGKGIFTVFHCLPPSDSVRQCPTVRQYRPTVPTVPTIRAQVRVPWKQRTGGLRGIPRHH